MKKSFIITLLITISLFSSPFKALSIETQTFSWGDKIIALDAGHGGTNLGATYPPNEGEGAEVYEKDINIATVYALKARLERVGAKVVLTRECDEYISRRKDRVDIAKEKCAELDFDNDGEADGRECDVLVSLHHNGNIDATHDGMMAIYNNEEDFILATYLHDRLLEDLFNNDSTYDEGYDRGGYGMTVYFTPASLTEGYYITNKCEAELFRPGTIATEEKDECAAIESADGNKIYNFNGETAVLECTNPDETFYELEYEYGLERVNQEADALYNGLFNYFNSFPENGGDNGGDKCPPGQEKQDKC